MLVRDQRSVLARENVREILQIPAAIFARGKIRHQSLAHGVNDRSPTPSPALHNLLQFLKLIKIINYRQIHRGRHIRSKDYIRDRPVKDFQ